ncbi:hypothetical protein M422DRAFT_40717 [Sphaerobolus stellatus SS14]|nr:hypothetical protein M422DRAFT_40717 [Sphaerobolus stellatus SS14]
MVKHNISHLGLHLPNGNQQPSSQSETIQSDSGPEASSHTNPGTGSGTPQSQQPLNHQSSTQIDGDQQQHSESEDHPSNERIGTNQQAIIRTEIGRLQALLDADNEQQQPKTGPEPQRRELLYSEPSEINLPITLSTSKTTVSRLPEIIPGLKANPLELCELI